MVVSTAAILVAGKDMDGYREARRSRWEVAKEKNKDLLGTRSTDHRSRPRQLLPQPMIVLLQPPELELMHRRLVCSARHLESGEDAEV
jgi:hypothetical protein